MKQIIILLLAAGIGSSARAENKTDTSLFMTSDSSDYQTEIQSKSGDLYLSIGHPVPLWKMSGWPSKCSLTRNAPLMSITRPEQASN
jgi:hypothetical protein